MVRARTVKRTLEPAVLRWSRERAGLAPQELAAKLKIPAAEVVEWEKEGRIGMHQIRMLSHQTLTPLGCFFLDAPLDDKLPVADFRTVGNAAPRRPSPELYATMMAMLLRKDWVREKMERDGDPPLDFVHSHNYKKSSPEAVAQHMRDTFSLAGAWQRGKNFVRAREHLFDCMENAGILTVINGIVGNNTHRPLDPAEFRGFALVDKRAPLIFVNGNDAHAAQNFTLANEAAHLFIGEGGVSLCNILEESQSVETFCNKVAASFLVPEELCDHLWHSVPKDEKRLGAVAQVFCVSKPVIALRARELRLITPKEFREFYIAYKKPTTDIGKPPRMGGGNFWNLQKYRIGVRFGDSVVRAMLAGEMQERDAWSLTGLNRKTFDELVEKRRMLL